MWSVYVLKHSSTGKSYIGKTGNLRARLEQHNRGYNKATRRKNGKWVLVYAEAYKNKADADMREHRLKNHGRAKQELFKRIKQSLEA